MKNNLNREKSGPRLLRKMGLVDTTLLVIGSVLGSGIFLTTGYIAEMIPSPSLIMFVWLTGGIVALCGALSLAELGAMFPQAGGQYVYLKEAYGTWAGFLYGWAFFWVIECGGIAALAVGFVEYLSFFLNSLAEEALNFKLKIFNLYLVIYKGQLISVISIIVLSFINYKGLKKGILVQNILTIIKLLGLIIFSLYGILLSGENRLPVYNQSITKSSSLTIGMFLLALIAVMWTYDGWYSVLCTAEEIKKPQKNLPLGLFLGVSSVTLIYILVNSFYILAVPIEEMEGVTRVAEIASKNIFGTEAMYFINALIMITIFGCLSSTVIYGPRVYYAMAKDGIFFNRLSSIHKKYNVPSRAIIWQAIWSSILCLSGTYRDLYEYVVFALLIFFAATGMAVIIFRKKHPNYPRPYKTWGYPLLPLIFVAINLGIVINTIIIQTKKSLIGLFIILIGIPYYYFKRKK